MAQSRDLTRRGFLTLAGSALATSALAACSSPAAQSSPTANPATAPNQAPKPSAPADAAKPAQTAGPRPVVPKAAAGSLRSVQMTVCMSSGPQAEIHTRNAPLFTPYTQGKVTVVVDVLPRNTGEQVWLTKMQAQSSEWDAVQEQASRFPMSAPAGFLVPLSKFMNNRDLFDAEAYDLNDFPQAELDTYRHNGELYAFPQEMSALMFFYRKDLLDKWGIKAPGPDGYSWEELHETSLAVQEKIKSAGMADTFALTWGGIAGQARHLYSHVSWGMGNEFMADDSKVKINSESAIKAMELVNDLIFKDKVVSPAVIGYNLEEVNAAYGKGKAVMAIQWNAAAPAILDPQTSPDAAAGTAFSIFPYWKSVGSKQSRVQANVHATAVSAFSKNPEEAFAYAAWFTSKEVAREYVMQGGGSSGRQSLLGDPEILKKNPQYDALKRSGLVYHGIPRSAYYSYILTNVIGPNVNAAFAGKAPMKECLDAAQADAVSYLKQSGVQL